MLQTSIPDKHSRNALTDKPQKLPIKWYQPEPFWDQPAQILFPNHTSALNWKNLMKRPLQQTNALHLAEAKTSLTESCQQIWLSIFPFDPYSLHCQHRHSKTPQALPHPTLTYPLQNAQNPALVHELHFFQQSFPMYCNKTCSYSPSLNLPASNKPSASAHLWNCNERTLHSCFGLEKKSILQFFCTDDPMAYLHLQWQATSYTPASCTNGLNMINPQTKTVTLNRPILTFLQNHQGLN